MTAEPVDDEMWSAIGDPSRRRVLDLVVGNSEVSASWLAGRVPFSRQAVSKHLVVLEDAGLVSRRKSGREVLYRVDADRLDQATRAIAQVAAQWERRLESIQTHRRSSSCRSKGPALSVQEEGEAAMTDQSPNLGGAGAGARDDWHNVKAARDAPGVPAVTDRATFQTELDRLRVREKAHTQEGDAIAAARRQLPMVEVDGAILLDGQDGPTTLLSAFEGRRQLIAYHFMWHPGHPAAEQCEGCTWVTTQITELSYLHSRDITFAVFCQGPYEESVHYHDFMGWRMPWYSVQDSLDVLLTPPKRPGMMHLVCYLRDGDRVFETYWTTRRGVEVMDYSYALIDLTVYGRQEAWEDSPPGWPRHGHLTRTDDGPPDWPRVSTWPG